MRQTIQGTKGWMEITDKDTTDEIVRINTTLASIAYAIDDVSDEIADLHKLIYAMNQDKIFEEGTNKRIKVYQEKQNETNGPKKDNV